MPQWRSYFINGEIDLLLPLLDERGRPNAQGLAARCTREIFLKRGDLERLLDNLPPAPLANSNLRHPSDAPLIHEALQSLLEGKTANALQAAKLVFSRAEGPSPEANLDRLRKLTAAE
jgi:hypothetical protein